MPVFIRTILLTACGGLVVALLSGCMTFELNPEPSADKLPPVTKQPLHVGVYYSAGVTDYQHTRTSGQHTWTARIGPASVKLLDQTFARAFEKVSRVAALSTERLAALGVDVVIAPTIEHFDFRLGLDQDDDRYSIAYRMTLYSGNGVPGASWVVVGNAPSRPWGSFGTTVWSWMEDDMLDAAAKFLESFAREAAPTLIALARKGPSPAPVDPRNVVLSADWGVLPNLTDEQRAALTAAGVLIVKVAVRSESGRELVVRSSDMRLRLNDGRVIEPSALGSVLSHLDKAQFDPTMGFTGPILGLMVQAQRQAELQRERGAQVTAGGETLFADRRITKDKEEEGIVLFRIADAPGTGAATLNAWIVDPSTGDGAQSEIALPAFAVAR